MWAIKGECALGLRGSAVYQRVVTWPDVTAAPPAKKTRVGCWVGWPAQTHSLPTNVLLVPKGFMASPSVIHNRPGSARNYRDLSTKQNDVVEDKKRKREKQKAGGADIPGMVPVFIELEGSRVAQRPIKEILVVQLRYCGDVMAGSLFLTPVSSPSPRSNGAVEVPHARIPASPLISESLSAPQLAPLSELKGSF